MPRFLFFLLVSAHFVLSEDSSESGSAEGPDTCINEITHSYRLYPSEETELQDPFYICPYIEESCCSFDSQKMIQILWIRISQPRLQRVLTHNLSSVEFIIDSMKQIFNTFERTKLPKNKKYSAECLQAVDDMQELIEGEIIEELDKMFEELKLAFNNLYKFKRQFYCDICDVKNQKFFNVVNKRVDYSNAFCQKFSTDFSPIAHFLNIEIVRIFTAVKNYVQCYSNKNFLFLKSLDDFRIPGEDYHTINNCKEDMVCAPFCQRYSMTDLPELIVGKKEFLDRMVFYLKHHKPDSKGFFISEPDYVHRYNEMLLQEHLETLKDAGQEVDAEEENKLNSKIFFEKQSLEREEKVKKGQDIETAMMDMYRNSFEFFRTKYINNKMHQIRKRISDEYSEKMVFQNFLTANEANVDLQEYKIKLEDKGFDPYELLDKEKMYLTNANLTLFTKEISNLVPDLLYLNETKIMDDMSNTGKLQNNEEAKEAVDAFIKDKMFDKGGEDEEFILENPFLDTDLSAGRLGFHLLLLLVLTNLI